MLNVYLMFISEVRAESSERVCIHRVNVHLVAFMLVHHLLIALKVFYLADVIVEVVHRCLCQLACADILLDSCDEIILLQLAIVFVDIRMMVFYVIEYSFLCCECAYSISQKSQR